MKTIVWIISFLLVLFVGAFYVFNTYIYKEKQNSQAQSGDAILERYMDIETYVRTNISELSPTPAVLGGTFYVTKIEAADGRGVVEYEDGHIALIADFTYTIEKSGNPVISTFIVREQ